MILILFLKILGIVIIISQIKTLLNGENIRLNKINETSKFFTNGPVVGSFNNQQEIKAIKD